MTVGLAIMYFYDHGVARRDFRDLALELKRRGHSVVIFAARWKSEMLPDIRHVRVRAKGRDTIAKLRCFHRNLRRVSRNMSIDCMVAFSRIPGADFYYAGEHENADKWQKKYGMFRFLMIGYWRERMLEKAIYAHRRATKIWILSPVQKRRIMTRFRVPEERMELLPLGVPSEIHRLSHENIAECRVSLREKLGIGDGEKVCVMMGSDFEGKGVDRAIMALSYLSNDELQRVYLVVSGKGSIARMDSLARHYSVRDRFSFVEKMAPERLLSAADLVLAPSRRGVFDAVALEALACGIPAVVTEKYAFADFIAKHGGVVMEEPFHCRTLTRVLQNFLADPEKLDALKEKAVAFDPVELSHRIPLMADRIGDFMA